MNNKDQISNIRRAIMEVFGSISLPDHRARLIDCASTFKTISFSCRVTLNQLNEKLETAKNLLAELEKEIWPSRYEDHSTPQRLDLLVERRQEIDQLNLSIEFIEAMLTFSTQLTNQSKQKAGMNLPTSTVLTYRGR